MGSWEWGVGGGNEKFVCQSALWLGIFPFPTPHSLIPGTIDLARKLI